MNSKEYQENAKKTMAKLPIRDWDEIHMVLGMLTEAGELADAYKKYIAYIKPIDYVNVKEELGDLLWYIANMCNIFKWDLEDIFELNIEKLKAIYSSRKDRTLFVRPAAYTKMSDIRKIISLAKKMGVMTVGLIIEYFEDL